MDFNSIIEAVSNQAIMRGYAAEYAAAETEAEKRYWLHAMCYFLASNHIGINTDMVKGE